MAKVALAMDLADQLVPQKEKVSSEAAAGGGGDTDAETQK
jgi:hypothetical protein